MKKVTVLLLILAFAFSAPALANRISENAESDDYLVKAPAMILRGAGNVVLGAVEILEHGYKGTMEGAPIPGLYSAGRTACGVPRTAAGYASGMSVGDATYFGRVTGKRVAVAETRAPHSAGGSA